EAVEKSARAVRPQRRPGPKARTKRQEGPPMVRIPTGSTIARCLAAALFTLALTSTSAFAVAQNSDQQSCLNAMNGNGAKVAAAQGKENTGCVKGVGSGKVISTADACLTADSKLKVSKAKQ